MPKPVGKEEVGQTKTGPSSFFPLLICPPARLHKFLRLWPRATQRANLLLRAGFARRSSVSSTLQRHAAFATTSWVRLCSGSESWCEVPLRLHSAMDTISLHYAGQRVRVFTYQFAALCMRYIIEAITKGQILDIDREGEIANCAINGYLFDTSARHKGDLSSSVTM